jgi:hypothetical protein
MTTRSGPDGADSGRGRPDPDLDAVMGERRQLTNLTYRLPGSQAEGEDAVQETYARWGVPGHPSKHGANIGGHPCWRRGARSFSPIAPSASRCGSSGPTENRLRRSRASHHRAPGHGTP